MTDVATEISNRSELTVSEAICEAIGQEMARDDRVLVLGEDVATYGGVFGATDGLLAQFGDRRVRDMPISEMAFTGMCVGLAMKGYRPLVEIMFADFVGVCLEQVFNAIAKIPYMSGGRVRMPVVVKTAAGCIGAAAQHSQCLWATFAHLPGMRVVCPSSPFMAKGLMTASLRSDDPVVYVEHKAFMRRRAADFPHPESVPLEPYALPLDQARVVRPGSDVTVVTVSLQVNDSLQAAAALARHGIEVEVVDIVSLKPFDRETVASSVARTRRLLVVDEDYLSYGLSAEVLAQVVEAIGPRAVRQYRRLAVPDVPIPAALTLERAVIPSAQMIEDVVRSMMEEST